MITRDCRDYFGHSSRSSIATKGKMTEAVHWSWNLVGFDYALFCVSTLLFLKTLNAWHRKSISACLCSWHETLNCCYCCVGIWVRSFISSIHTYWICPHQSSLLLLFSLMLYLIGAFAIHVYRSSCWIWLNLPHESPNCPTVILNVLDVEIRLKSKIKYITKKIFDVVKVELDHILVEKHSAVYLIC